MTNVYDFSARAINGEDINLGDYQGKWLLIVNTASKCGFTPQYKGLEALYQKFRDKGLEIIGFPCNQFGNQEPGTEESIQQSCELNFGVTFPLMAKVEVNGNNALPLFDHLKQQAPGLMGSTKIKWNFTKFLVDPEGKVVERFAPLTTPEKLEKIIADKLG